MEPGADSADVVCDYCVENPSPAVKTCLKCETSFCSSHLKPHLLNKAFSGHTLIEPVADLTDRQCVDHKKILEYYYKDDAEYEELEREIESLQGVQQNCSSKQRDLERSEAEIKTRINELKGKLSKSFSEWRRQLEEDEEYALKLIDEEGLRALSQIRSCSEALNKRMEQITLIDGETQNPDVPALTLNLSNISQLIQKRLNGSEKYHSDILGIIVPASTEYRGPSNVTPPPHSSSGAAPVPGNVLQLSTGITGRAGISQGQRSPMSLDPKTVNWNLVLSDDLRSVTWTEQKQPYPPHPERFKHRPQVLCSQSFSSGSHSWDVETDGEYWGIGIVCGSVEREGNKSELGDNSKSWCLEFYFGDYFDAWHNSKFTDLPLIPSNSRIRVQLDYEAGTLSFHRVTDSLRHLHTFQTTFTEPVFPAFYCGNNSLKLLN
ncbi:E3 ubiquitin/ISG15 ligase TRIM25-like [Heptranchias perlo]|uniref:E3 ubiquitin/ISG15 ligase TRIM25-like n=1 Tax=Heptranchias perlo TaxID=212740 RepID=UPI0035597BD5